MRGQEKVTKEKATPLPRLAGTLPARFACVLRGLSTGPPALTPNWSASMPTTLRAVPPPARRCRGAPGRATRILRVLFRRTRSRAPSLQPSPRQSRERGQGSQRLASLFSSSALQLSPPRSGGASRAGQDGPLLYPGPLCGGEVGTTDPQGSRQGCRLLFARTGVRSKSPAPAHGLVGQDSRQAPSGVAFSLGYFSLGHAREKWLGRQRRTKALASAKRCNSRHESPRVTGPSVW